MTKSLVVEGSRATELLGIRFHPGAAKLFLPVSMHELVDQRVSGGDLTNWALLALENILDNGDARIVQLEKSLTDSLVRDRRYSLMHGVFRLTKNSAGNIQVCEIANTLGVSRQYLNRVMREFVGVDLKLFQRIWRMRSLTSSLSKVDQHDWANHAVNFGYYDQSHLINDFNELVGMTPTQYLES